MNKAAFALAFQDAVESACRSAEKSLGKTLSRDVIVRMYGAGTNGLDISPEEFIDRAYTKSSKAEPMGPIADSNRHDEPGAFDQFVPVEAAMIDDVFVAGKDPVG